MPRYKSSKLFEQTQSIRDIYPASVTFLFPGAPCLSFDILRDDLGERREEFPMTCYLVAGTQSDKSKSNEVIVLKLTNMNRVRKKVKDDESDSDSESDEDDDRSKFESASLRHEGSVNRIRASMEL